MALTPSDYAVPVAAALGIDHNKLTDDMFLMDTSKEFADNLELKMLQQDVKDEQVQVRTLCIRCVPNSS